MQQYGRGSRGHMTDGRWSGTDIWQRCCELAIPRLDVECISRSQLVLCCHSCLARRDTDGVAPTKERDPLLRSRHAALGGHGTAGPERNADFQVSAHRHGWRPSNVWQRTDITNLYPKTECSGHIGVLDFNITRPAIRGEPLPPSGLIASSSNNDPARASIASIGAVRFLFSVHYVFCIFCIV